MGERPAGLGDAYAQGAAWACGQLGHPPAGDVEGRCVCARHEQARARHADPRALGGEMISPYVDSDERRSGQGDVLLDTSKALLPDYTQVAMFDDSAAGPMAAVEISGRINHTDDRATVLLVGGPDALAAWVSELLALAAVATESSLRAHRKWAQRFMDDLSRRMKRTPT